MQKEYYAEFLKHLDHCPFCDISETLVIAQTEHVYTTVSVAPYHKDHMLIVPLRHMESVLELSDIEKKEIDHHAVQALKLINKLGHTGATILVREGMTSGKSIPHVHYHIVPDVVMQYTTDPSARTVLTDEEKLIEVQRLRETSAD